MSVVRVGEDDLVDFAAKLLEAAGSTAERARIVAKVLVLADARGIASHGLNRLHIYCDELEQNRVEPHAELSVVNDLGAAVLVDAGNGQGIAMSEKAMNLAIDRARKFGVGVVSVRNTNHFGIAGYWTLMAAKAGMLGMAFCNTSVVAVPFRSRVPAMGTNPIACAAPVMGDRPAVVDMATTTVPFGRFEAYVTAKLRLPTDRWGVDKEGRLTDDPNEVINGGGGCYLGGDALGAGHKGYALGYMVEMLCGVLSGSSFGPNISHSMNPNALGSQSKANLGHCFVAVDVTRLSGGYADRLGTLNKQLRALPRATGADGPVLVPGDVEWANEDRSKEKGVPLNTNLWKRLVEMAKNRNIDVPAVRGVDLKSSL